MLIHDSQILRNLNIRLETNTYGLHQSGQGWNFQSRTQAHQLHRKRLSERSDDFYPNRLLTQNSNSVWLLLLNSYHTQNVKDPTNYSQFKG